MSLDRLQGAAAERAAIVAWLRRHTHLLALAKLLEDQAHHMPLSEARNYVKANGIHAIGDIGEVPCK